ncbi:hypothetical protein [Streptomyces sp. NPDC014733]|uniref:hypothetical protein n=1 Tax=Streptomyces sp. NPDC014733 TaxID=3364885 RepID=UPI0036FB866F
MSTPASRAAVLACRSDQVGRCARCQNPCQRYGAGGNPLCQDCLAEVREAQGRKQQTSL